MTFGFISDKPVSEREQFLLELVNHLEDLGAERIGVFAILPNGETFQGYYRMEFGDKLLMSGHVQMDAVEVGSCEGCYWKEIGRQQKCSCCRRNRYMKDNYRRAEDGF